MIPELVGLLTSEKEIAPVPVPDVAVMVSYPIKPAVEAKVVVVAVSAIGGLTVIAALNEVAEPRESVADTVSLITRAVVAFIAVTVSAITIVALFARDVSRVIPATTGESVKVLVPVPALATKADDLFVIPCVVVTETLEEAPDGCALLPVGAFTLVLVREKLDESVNFASEFTAPNASNVFASTAENFDGVKLAALKDVPEYLGVLDMVKFAICPPKKSLVSVLHSDAIQRLPVEGRLEEVTAVSV